MSKLKLLIILILVVSAIPGHAQCVDENQKITSAVNEMNDKNARISRLNAANVVDQERVDGLGLQKAELESESLKIQNNIDRGQGAIEAFQMVQPLLEAYETLDGNQKILNDMFIRFLEARPSDPVALSLRNALLASKDQLPADQYLALSQVSETLLQLETSSQKWLSQMQKLQSQLVANRENAIKQVLMITLTAMDRSKIGQAENQAWLSSKQTVLKQVVQDIARLEQAIQTRKAEIDELNKVVRSIQPQVGNLRAAVKACWKFADRLPR